MTDEMPALAEENERESELANAYDFKSEIENIPLLDDSGDVIISNRVIDLSGDKSRVSRGTFRVPKPGGLFAVSDVVVRVDRRRGAFVAPARRPTTRAACLFALGRPVPRGE